MKNVDDVFVDGLIKSLKESENSLFCSEGYFGFNVTHDSRYIEMKMLGGLKGIENVLLVVEIGKDWFGDKLVKKVSYTTDRKFGSEKEIVNGKNVNELKKLVFSLIKRAKSKEVEENKRQEFNEKLELIQRLKEIGK